MSLVVLTGASGAGKTAIAEAIAASPAGLIEVHYFDRIGVPSVAEMIAVHGSPEAWQRAMTIAWLGRLAAEPPGKTMLLEGQMRLSFLAEAAAAARLAYKPVLVDGDDATRARRLSVDRGQPELANDEMMNWAAHLRAQAAACRCDVLDTTHLSIAEGAAAVTALFPS